MADKIKVAIPKLKNIKINYHQVYIFFNTYLLKSVYFGARIVQLNKEQEEYLKKIYEETIASKLRLEKKFPRSILYF